MHMPNGWRSGIVFAADNATGIIVIVIVFHSSSDSSWIENAAEWWRL